MQHPFHIRIRHWLFDDALPFWAENGLDKNHGGYVEYFETGSLKPFTGERRVRTIARQIYVFSHASLLGVPNVIDCAKHGFSFLIEHGWQSPQSGWARTLNQDGSVKDATPDLYEQAFILFALAWFYRATKAPEALEAAEKTFRLIEDRFRAPNEGFWHELPAKGHRQQNPHMHLLEAVLAWQAAAPSDRYASLGKELVALCQKRFFNSNTGTLTEFFAQDWSRAEGEAGRLTEPGHHFEWAWILTQAKTLLGCTTDNEVRKLIAFAEKFGVDPKSGAVYQQVRDDGAPIDTGSRTWPNTERLKAAVALYDLDGVDPRPALEQTCTLLLDRYLAHEPKGTWTDKFDATGASISKTIPASTFYHLFLAFAETIRVMETLEHNHDA